MFIALAGIDGLGKSTLARELAARICEQGYHVRLTYEPGGTRLGRSIRQLLLATAQEQMEFPAEELYALDTDTAWFAEKPDPLAELLLFAAARAQHCVQIRKWLYDDEVVISDRFSLCTRAYQGARGIKEETIDRVEKIATAGLTPDITLLLDGTVAEAQQRLFWGRRQRDRFESEKSEYMERVRYHYLQAAKHTNGVVIINAMMSPEEVFHQAWTAIFAAMQNRGKDMRVGRPSTRRAASIVRVAQEWKAQNRVLMPKDLAEATGASTTSVRRALRSHGLWDDAEEAAMKQERTRRVNQAKADSGYPSLQRQAAAGHPQLRAAREARLHLAEEIEHRNDLAAGNAS